MQCNIIKYDKRFIDLDLDVIGGIHYEAGDNGICIRMDTFLCSKTVPRFKDFEEKWCEFLIVPESIVDVLPNVLIVGEVWAEMENVNDWWTWQIDRGMAEMAIMDFYIRVNYLKHMSTALKHQAELRRGHLKNFRK